MLVWFNECKLDGVGLYNLFLIVSKGTCDRMTLILVERVMMRWAVFL